MSYGKRIDPSARSRRAGWRMLVWVGLGAGAALAMAADLPSAAPAVSVATAEAPARLVASESSVRVARLLSQMLPRTHLSRRAVDSRMAADALEIYLNDLDFDHTFLLAGDTAEFQRESADLADQLRKGDLSFAFKVFARFKERVADRTRYVEALLKQGFEANSKDTYDWKRKDAPRAGTRAEWDALWQRKVQNEYLARIVAVQLSAATATNAVAVSTNAVPSAPAVAAITPAEPQDAPAAGSRESARGDKLEDAHLTPEEFVLKRYKQYEIVLNDADEEYVLDRFYSAFTQAYDPHSEYLSPARSEDFDITMKLSLCGVGALLSSEDGAAKIERVIPGGPADRDGRLQPGDRIVAVGEGGAEPVDILHWPLYKAVRKIRGAKGTKVLLVVWPAADVSGATEKRIELVRDEVKLEEQAAKGDIREVRGPDGRTHKLGVLTLPEFYADFKGSDAGESEPRRSAADVRRILLDLRRQGAEGVALDLRNNGGGALPDAIEIAGLFFHTGPVVQVKDAQDMAQVLSDPDPDLIFGGPLVVLINRMSASASEIVAACLQDYGRAVIIGDSKTHGKGTVQTLIPLDPRRDTLGSLKVTTASFYRIAGGSTQRKGVEADIVLPSVFDFMELGEEYLPHALPYSVVEPAFYATFVNQHPSLDELRSRSAQRCATSAEFQNRKALLARLKDRVNAQTITLNLDERLKLARAEKELDELQRAAEEEVDRSEEKKDGPDLVMDESLNILADMVSWKSAQAANPPVDFAEHAN